MPQELLDRARVPQEQKAEVERLIAAQGDDVQGHAGLLAVVIAIDVALLGGALAVGIGFTGPADVGKLKGIKPREQLVGGGGQKPS